MLYGIDISNWNNPSTETYRKCDFLIHKLTEGRTYVDPTTTRHVTDYLLAKPSHEVPCLGLYHFAQVRMNSVSEEASNFLKAYAKFVKTFDEPAIPIIDVEAGNQNYPDKIFDLAHTIYQETNITPMIYASASWVKNLMKCYLALDCGLWVANYKRNGNTFPAVTPDTINPWHTLAIWQYSNGQTPIAATHWHINEALDQNVFNGESKHWLAYARGSGDPIVTCTHCPIHCPED